MKAISSVWQEHTSCAHQPRWQFPSFHLKNSTLRSRYSWKTSSCPLQIHHYTISCQSLPSHLNPCCSTCRATVSLQQCWPSASIKVTANVPVLVEVSKQDSSFRKDYVELSRAATWLVCDYCAPLCPLRGSWVRPVRAHLTWFLKLLNRDVLQLCAHSHQSPWALNKLKLWFLAWRGLRRRCTNLLSFERHELHGCFWVSCSTSSLQPTSLTAYCSMDGWHAHS